MPPVGFEPKISASERSQTYTLDRANTETGRLTFFLASNSVSVFVLKTFTCASGICDIITQITDTRRLTTGDMF